jgi:dimethylhistidine N-methyltransferase
MKGDPFSAVEFAKDVRRGLSKPGQKELYSKYFYDDLGTALFEAITLLPEYGLTRADVRLLKAHGRELSVRAGSVSIVAELGSGSGEKARLILPHLKAPGGLTYCPIDISPAALIRCERDVNDIPRLRIASFQLPYVEGLAAASRLRKSEDPMLVLFLGSSIGNFEPHIAVKFLRDVREILAPSDLVLLSTDLVKAVELMLAAYRDELGLTAAFNLNLLARINRELEADFDLGKFEHEARYSDVEQRIEMHLRSSADQTVSIDRDFKAHLKKGETIWTESSYKFQPEQVKTLARSAGFDCEAQWIDAEWPFAQNLLRAV